MVGWRGNGNGIETCGNGKDWGSWEPFPNTSNTRLGPNTMLKDWLIFMVESHLVYCLLRRRGANTNHKTRNSTQDGRE